MTIPLYTPSVESQQGSNLARFLARLNRTQGLSLATYWELHAYSVAQPAEFWKAVWEFADVRGEGGGGPVLVDGATMQEARFFPEARLSYAENLLKKFDDTPALVFRGEDRVYRRMSWRELHQGVARLQRALERAGVRQGDRVCAIIPNMPEAIVALLAVTSLGAIWSSCSPDFGQRGILDRFGQLAPKCLIASDGYYYAGKTHRLGEKLRGVLAQLPTVETSVIVDYLGEAADVAAALPKAVTLSDFTASEADGPVTFTRMPFDHPLYILHSSGTTGIPKCIVHSTGGILLKHAVELLLQTDLRETDRLFYFSTCSWMMWNWLVSGLMAGATLLLYDGSPFHPHPRVLFDYADAEGMTIFGTSAKYLDALGKTAWQPKTTHRLETLRAVLSTGSPLAPTECPA